MNLKSLLIVALGLCCAFAASPANATFVTGTTNINVNSGPVGPPINDITQISQTTGELYTNNLGDGGVGSTVVTVGVSVIASVDQAGIGQSPIGGPGASTQQMVVAFAIEGTVISVVGGVATALFTDGGFGIWQSAKTEGNVRTFVKTNPSTWFN